MAYPEDNTPKATGLKLSPLQLTSNDYLGTSLGIDTGLKNNRVSYVGSNGQEMVTGDLTGNKEALDWFKSNPTSAENSVFDNFGLGDLSGFEKVQTGLGAIGTVYSLYDNLFGDTAKTSKLQQKNLQTQVDTNKYLLESDKARKANIAKYFG